MSNRTIEMDDRTYDYLCEVSLREAEVLEKLRATTSELTMARMQISPEQGQFMALLAKMCADGRPAELGSPKFVEVGTFTGYSALVVALAVPDASVLCCDINEEWTAIGRAAWEDAAVASRVELVLQPATDTLQARLDDGEAGTFDFAFIDADKGNYVNYYELCLKLVRPGGIIAVDNVLWSGRAADPSDEDEETVGIRAFNSHVAEDARVDLSMLPVGDGLTLLRRR